MIEIAIILILVLLVLAIIPMRASTASNANKTEDIHALIRQVYRWHVASTQDENSMIAMLHSNYAVGYIGALRSIASEAQIQALTGLNLYKLEKEVAAQQDKALSTFAKKCPMLMPTTPAYDEYIKKFLHNQ